MTTPCPLEISVEEVARLRQEAMLRQEPQPFVLLDVREPVETAHCRIEGSLLIPMSELRDRMGELEPHRSNRIVVHCHHGVRSLRVTEAMREMGFDQVQSMAGGIESWSLEIDPAVPRY